MADTVLKIDKSASFYDTRFQELVRIFISSVYPCSIKLAGSSNSSFPLNAVYYSEFYIISSPKSPDIKSLSKRINHDIQTLQKQKYPSIHLIYLVSNEIFIERNDINKYNLSLSKNGYRVIIYDDLLMEELLIRNHKPPPLPDDPDLKLSYGILYDVPKVEQSVIEEIFTFVNSDLKNDVYVPPFEKKYPKLQNKVKDNFNSRFYKEVKDIFDSNWSNKICVEEFIKHNFHRFESQLYTILYIVRNNFKKVKENTKGITDFPVNNPVYFEYLAEQILQEEKRSEPRYLLAATAIILFFFEYCDFGRKTMEDPPSLFPKLDGRDDNSF